MLNGVSFSVHSGEILGLLGPNGAGKSTVMKLLVGLIKADGGDVLWQGQSIWKDLRVFRQRCGILIEGPALFPYLPAKKNLSLAARYSGLNPDQGYLERLLEVVGLSPRNEQQVSQYSLGMKQRLGLALALVHQPDFLLLDEPFNGLDPNGVRELRLLLEELAYHEGKTILLSSHMLGEVEELCERLVLINDGKVVKEGNLTDLMNEGKSTYIIECEEIDIANGVLKAFGETTQNRMGLSIDLSRNQVPEVLSQLQHHKVRVFAMKQKNRLEGLFQ